MVALDSTCLTPSEFHSDRSLYDEMLQECIPDSRYRAPELAAHLPEPKALSTAEIEAFRRCPAERPLWLEALWFAAKYVFWMALTYAVIVAGMCLSGGAR